MLIRIRCKDGNFRFEVQPTDNITVLVQKIVEHTENADPNTITISDQPKGNEKRALDFKGQTLKNLGLKHGDLLFVSYKSQSDASSASGPVANGDAGPQALTAKAPEPAHRPWESVVEEPVDVYWRSREGKIPRSRDSRFCKHGPNAMCDYCMPLEPYDPTYQKEHNIKHLSFHSYLRKIMPPSSSSSSSTPPLEALSYKVKVPCPNGKHPPWPAGICTACQPSAITLQPQIFRAVDHLEFSSEGMVDRFLHAWRRTGVQRFGWLIGHYEPYDVVPMGIKAVVEAIHEPPQQGELDGLTLGLPWEDEARIRALASSASPPLSIVGCIFTDLDPSEEDRTKNVYKRHPNSFYLSSLEAIFAATMQLQNPTKCRSSPTGLFSSRMVTAVATGTPEGGVDIAAYQVSEQACAMVDADMIEASVDPGIVRLKEEDANASRYVPDVFFRYKNEYGIEVKKNAKPSFPVEYLLVNVTHGFPSNPSPMFASTSFPIENRPGLEDQDVTSLFKSLIQNGAPGIMPSASSSQVEKVAKLLSDWHLVAFLGTTGLLSEDDMKVFLGTITRPDLTKSGTFIPLLETDGWKTLMTLAREVAQPSPVQSRTRPLVEEDELDEDIREQIARMEAMEAASRSGSGSASRSGTSPSSRERSRQPAAPDHVMDDVEEIGGRTCPHCTFVNPPGGSDCEVCGLPL